jgi:hypothetical protein
LPKNELLCQLTCDWEEKLIDINGLTVDLKVILVYDLH